MERSGDSRASMPVGPKGCGGLQPCPVAKVMNSALPLLVDGGRDELNTMNLWGGMDAPMQAAG